MQITERAVCTWVGTVQVFCVVPGSTMYIGVPRCTRYTVPGCTRYTVPGCTLVTLVYLDIAEFYTLQFLWEVERMQIRK